MLEQKWYIIAFLWKFYINEKQTKVVFLALAAAEVGTGEEQFSPSERGPTHQK